MLCRRRPIAAVAEESDLILDLDHHDDVIWVGGREMLHQGQEGSCVCVSKLRREDREDGLGRLSGIGPDLRLGPGVGAWEALGVGTYPRGRVGGPGVLEGAEPDEHHAETLLACRSDLRVNETEVKVPFR